ncbi:MAG: hypothetical protein AAF533_17360 [Acidobacteriota bacterium]
MTDVDERNTEDEPHPRGTLAILALYGLAFLLGWLALYFGLFIPRGSIGG